MRWYLDLAIADPAPPGQPAYRVVGRIYQLAVEGTSAPGQVRQVGKWQAFGMRAAWCDVDLGATHATSNDARRAVADWWIAYQKEQAAAK